MMFWLGLLGTYLLCGLMTFFAVALYHTSTMDPKLLPHSWADMKKFTLPGGFDSLEKEAAVTTALWPIIVFYSIFLLLKVVIVWLVWLIIRRTAAIRGIAHTLTQKGTS